MPVKLDWSGWDFEGNLALVPEVQGDDGAPDIPDIEPSPSPPFSLKAGKKPRQVSEPVLAAFKRTCRDCGISIGWQENEPGRPRITLSSQDGRQGIALAGLMAKLAMETELEVALLLELAEDNEELAYIVEERAAIRTADDLPGDLESALWAMVAPEMELGG